MARERFVTRTITTNVIESVYVDLDKMEFVNDTFVVTGEEMDTKKATDFMNKIKCEGSRKFAKVIDVKHDTVLYGMPETEFIKYAKKMERSQVQ